MSVTVLTDLIAGDQGGTDLFEIEFGAQFAEMGRISSDVKLTYFSEPYMLCILCILLHCV